MTDLLFEEEWFRPISANDLMIGSLDMLLSLRLSCWCRCLTRRASLTCVFQTTFSFKSLTESVWWNTERESRPSVYTFSLASIGREPLLIMLSRTRSVICSKLAASMSNITVPFNSRLLSSNRACNERVATWGLLHLFPPSSTSSSNLIHLDGKCQDKYYTCLPLWRVKRRLRLIVENRSLTRSRRLPGRFLPFHLVAVPDELLHFGEERMRLVCIVPDLLAQDELHPLGWWCNCNFTRVS